MTTASERASSIPHHRPGLLLRLTWANVVMHVCGAVSEEWGNAIRVQSWYTGESREDCSNEAGEDAIQ